MKTSSSRRIEYSKARSSSRARGFTLLELLIVIAIAAILTAILIGGFFQVSASNRRSGCQVNLSQIYNALRQYANDYDGQYPYYNATVANGGVTAVPGPAPQNPPADTMGLWKLYTVPADPTNIGLTAFPATQMADGRKKPVGLYLRNATNLHCPNDVLIQDVDDDGDSTTPTVKVSDESLFTQNGARFNENYLSYQTIDDATPFYSPPTAPSTNNMPTYQSLRRADLDNAAPINPSSATWSRQLRFMDATGLAPVLEKRPASDTVILWCKWHRTGLGGRNNDIVLFADGSIKSRSLASDNQPTPRPVPGWLRTP